MDHKNEFENYIYTLSPNRQLLAAKLMDKRWFTNSDLATKREVLSLPNNFEGFVFDLSNRPDFVGNIEVLKLISLPRGNYLITPVFEVRSVNSRKKFTYEYTSWNSGPHSGIKGTLFIEKHGKITHFVTIEMPKFAPAKNHFDSIGGLVQYAGNKLVNLPKDIEIALKDQLGLSDLCVKQYIDLGQVSPDNGLTNNHPYLFAAILDGEHAQNVTSIQHSHLKTKPQGFQLQIMPIEQLGAYTIKSDDAFFLSAVCRLVAKKLISL